MQKDLDVRSFLRNRRSSRDQKDSSATPRRRSSARTCAPSKPRDPTYGARPVADFRPARNARRSTAPGWRVPRRYGRSADPLRRPAATAGRCGRLPACRAAQLPATLHLQRHGLTGVRFYIGDEGCGIVGRHAVDRAQTVARDKAGLLRRAARLHTRHRQLATARLEAEMRHEVVVDVLLGQATQIQLEIGDAVRIFCAQHDALVIERRAEKLPAQVRP